MIDAHPGDTDATVDMATLLRRLESHRSWLTARETALAEYTATHWTRMAIEAAADVERFTQRITELEAEIAAREGATL